MAIKPSPRLAMFLLLSHGIASAVVYETVMPFPAKLVMLTLVLLSLLYCLACDALLFFPDSWREISFDQDSMSVVTRGGSSYFGKIAGSFIASPYFVVLRVKLEGRRLPVYRTIFPDSLETGAFRELCVHLKFAQ